MTPLALLFTLAAIGISETSYLVREHAAKRQPVCVIGGGNCHTVLESKYNKTLGISNEILGLVFYTILALFSALLVIGVGPTELLVRIIEVKVWGSVIFSLYFIYIQWKIIKAWCFWCIMSAVTVFLIALIVLFADLV